MSYFSILNPKSETLPASANKLSGGIPLYILNGQRENSKHPSLLSFRGIVLRSSKSEGGQTQNFKIPNSKLSLFREFGFWVVDLFMI